jgi:beta-galactosidase
VDDNGDLAHPLLRRSPRLCLWRAQTDNDSSFLLDNRFVRSGFFQLHMSDVDIRDSTVTTRYEAAYGDEVIHRRTIRTIADDDHLLTEHVTLPPETRDGLRVGVEFELIDGFERAAWVGLGPWENYPDRRASALLGAWESAIDDLAVPYLLPQENGTRGDVTELRLTGAPGVVRTVHATPLHVNVSRHTTRELENATHWARDASARTPSGRTVSTGPSTPGSGA